jgi:hypothetical protein
MATRGPKSHAPVNTLMTMGGMSPEQLSQLSPAQRAQLLKRMKGTMPPNGSAPPAASGMPGGGGANTIFG